MDSQKAINVFLSADQIGAEPRSESITTGTFHAAVARCGYARRSVITFAGSTPVSR